MAGSKKAKARRRGRSPHPGVILIPPRGEHATWRARWRDPDTGRQTAVRVDPLDAPTAETRADWAVRKARELARRRMDIAAGDEPIAASALSDAVESYHNEAKNRLRQSTIDLYTAATDAFLAWAKTRGLSSTKDLKAPLLPGFRDYLLAQRKKSHARAGKGRKSARTAGSKKLSPQTINWQLRTVKTVLNHWRMRGQVGLSSDAIRDALKPVTVPREAPEFLRPHECAKLLEAALRHDADTYVATREEHAGDKPAGTTLRYDPIAPFIATVLLGGFRVGEALALRWSAVDLAAPGPDGQPAGEIRLKASDTKTKHARIVTLDVSPSLRTLLAALKLGAGNAAFVFGGKHPLERSNAEAARRRLTGDVPSGARKVDYGAPRGFTWQILRSTCATFGSNAPGVYGTAAAFASAGRLGHDVAVAAKHYAGQLSVSRDARTLEQAMGVEGLMARIVERASTALSCEESNA